jgi:predicted nuclease of predicted toxin-antitoxin system
MRILLDENIPRGLRCILQGHDVRTASEMGWAIANRQLLDEAEKAGFEALVTSDQNFVFQQNLAGRNIAVVVLSTNRWATIRAQPQTMQRAVANASPGTFSRVTLSGRQRRPQLCPLEWCRSCG